MKIVQVFQPQRGSIRKISLQEKLTLSLNFDLTSVESMQEGDDLLLVFSDGSIVLLEDFYSTKTPPMFLLANGEMVQSFEDMLASVDANMPQVDTSTEGLVSNNDDVLSLSVAAGNSESSNGGVGEYRDGSGNMVTGIDRLGLAASIDLAGNNLGNDFLSDNIGATRIPGNMLPGSTLGAVDSWKDLVDNNGGNGMQDSVSLFPSGNFGKPGATYSSVVIKFGEGWDLLNTTIGSSSQDKISINGQDFDPTKQSITVTIDNKKYTVSITPQGLEIKLEDGSNLSSADLDKVLGAFGYLNPDIANINGIYQGKDSVAGLIDYDYLSKLQTGFKEIDIIINGSNPADNETVAADLNFRELINLGQDVSTGTNVTVGAGTSSVVGGSTGGLTTNHDWVVIGTGGNDTIQVNGEGKDRYHMIVGGDGNDSINATSKDNYFVVGNGKYDSVSGTVDALAGQGNNTIVTGAGNDTIIGGAGKDSINAGSGVNVILTGGTESTEADTIVLNGNDTTTIIMDGDDKAEHLLVQGSIQDDTIKSQSQNATNTTKGDNVVISGSLISGLIDLGQGTDAVVLGKDMQGGTINTGEGKDTIIVGSTMSGGIINSGENDTTAGTEGDHIHIGAGNADKNTNTTVNPNIAVMDGGTIISSNKNDTIRISGAMQSGSISAGAGNDSILIEGSLFGGTIKAEEGDDLVQVNHNMTGGTIEAGAGNDTILVIGDIAGNASILGGEGKDEISVVGTANNSVNIDGGAGDDTIHVGLIAGGVVNGGADNDLIVAGQMSGGTITSTSGNNTVIIGHERIDGNSLLNGTIQLGGGDDFVGIRGSMSGGTIATGAGNDTIKIRDDISGGKIDAGNGDDSVLVQGNISNATISTGEGKDTVTINKDMVSGSIESGYGDDSILIQGNMGTGTCGSETGVTVDGGAGNDSITIGGNLNSGLINGGLGNDSILIQGNMNGGYINATEGKNTVKVEGEYTCGKIEFGADGGELEIGKSDFTHPKSLYTVDKNSVAMAGNAHLDLSKGVGVLATLHGDVKGQSSISLGVGSNAGKDTLMIHGSISENASITSDGGNDIYVAGRLQSGTISLNGAASAQGDMVVIGTHANAINPFVNAMVGGKIDASKSAANNTILLASHMIGGEILGGSGNEVIGVGGSVQGANTKIDGGAGNDIIFAEALTEKAFIDGGAGNDTILVSKINNASVNGGTGDDIIYSQSVTNKSSIHGGAGNDSIHVEIAAGFAFAVEDSKIDAGEGNDTITILGGVNNSTIHSGLGDDLIKVLGGTVGHNTTIDGGVGNDTVYVDSFASGVINGGVGNDLIAVDKHLGGTIYADKEGKDTQGNNTIAINELHGGRIEGGAGTNTIAINLMEKGVVLTNGSTNVVEITTMNGGALALLGKFNSLHIGTMNKGLIYSHDTEAKDEVHIDKMTDGAIAVGAGSDEITVKVMAGGSIWLGDGDDKLTIDKIINGSINLGKGNDIVTIKDFDNNTNGIGGTITITTESDATSNDTNTIIFEANSTDSWTGVTIQGSAAQDILDLNLKGNQVIAIDKLPEMDSVDLIRVGNGVIDFSNLTEDNISRYNATTGKLTIEIERWEQVKLGDESKWTQKSDNVYEFTIKDSNGNEKKLEVTFQGPDKDKDGKPDAIQNPDKKPSVSKPLAIEHDEEKEHNVAAVAAVALAMVAEEALAKEKTLFQEEAEDKIEHIEKQVMTRATIEDIQKIENTSVKEEASEENVQDIQGNILGGQEGIQENIIVLSPEYAIGEPSRVLDGAEEKKDVYFASEDIEVPVEVDAIELSFDEGVLEDIQVIEQSEETILDEQEFPLMPEVTELEVAINDLLSDATSTDIPREEVEVEETLYNSVAMDSWYASEVVVELSETEDRPFTIEDTQGIEFANLNAEAQPFTLEDAQIVSFELVAPSMEIQYDEQAY